MAVIHPMDDHPDFDISAIRRAVIEQADAAGAEGWFDMPVPREIRPSGLLRVPRGHSSIGPSTGAEEATSRTRGRP